MPASVFAQLVGLSAGVLLLTSVLLVWKRSLIAAARLLAVQGFALAALVAVIGVNDHDAQLIAVAGLVLALVVKLAVLGSALAAGEVFLAKLRLFRVPELLAGSFVLAFVAVSASYLVVQG